MHPWAAACVRPAAALQRAQASDLGDGVGAGRLLCVAAFVQALIAQAQPPSPAGVGLQDTLEKVKDVSRRAPLLKPPG